MLSFLMGRKLSFANILAAVIVIAAFAVPSLATAHEGHAHHTATVQKAAAAPSQTRSSVQAATVERGVIEASLTAAAPAPAGPVGSAVDSCASHCCGGSAGMTCCGAALAPDPFCVALFRASVPFAVSRDLPPSGLPPEALPKPPKSFA
jgi:hypothetical protein